MKAPERKPRSLTKRDPIKAAENLRKIEEALISNLNANMIKDAANRKKK